MRRAATQPRRTTLFPQQPRCRARPLARLPNRYPGDLPVVRDGYGARRSTATSSRRTGTGTMLPLRATVMYASRSGR